MVNIIQAGMHDNQINNLKLDLEKKSPSPRPDVKAYFKQLERRYYIGLLAAFFIPLIALSIYFHFQFHFTMKETGKQNLLAIAESHRNTLDLFLQERVVNLLSLFYSRDFTLTPSDRLMGRFLQNLRQSSDAFVDVGLINAEGIQIGYSGPFPFLFNQDYSVEDWYVGLNEPQRQHHISDVYLGFRNSPHFTIAVKQIIDGRPFVLRATLDPDRFYNFLQTINRIKSMEAFIINTNGVYQAANAFRHDAFEKSGYVPPLDQAAGVLEMEGANGSVLMAHAWLKEARWSVLISEPLKMAYADIYRARQIIMASTALIVVIVVFLVWLTTHALIIKARKSYEQRDEMKIQLIHASKLASIGELATGVAHEINNPLAIIMATSGVIRDILNPEFHFDASPENIIQELDTIDTAVLRAKKITQQLLNYGRKSDHRLVYANINSIINEVLSSFREKTFALSQITLVREFDETIPDILVDPDQIYQVFLNLINNAGDAIQGPGKITVTTRKPKDNILVTITDTGKGMDAELLRNIFTPFYTTKEPGKGTGLGLSVSLSIVESMGGTIEVQSLPGAGSAFTVVLPGLHSQGEINVGTG